MRSVLRMLSASALSLSLILSFSACARPPSRIAAAAAEQGKAQAGIILPLLSAECRREFEHAAARLGDNVVIVLARERSQLDLANGVIRRCADHYDTLKADLEGRG